VQGENTISKPTSTPKPTPAPSAVLKDKYDIKAKPSATIFKFDNGSTGEEMTVTYIVNEVYLGKTILSFFTVDEGGTTCLEGIKAGQMKVVSGPTQVGQVEGSDSVYAQVKVDMDLPNIVKEKEIYSEISDITGKISVCVRADVVETAGTGASGANEITLDDGKTTGVSVSFTETIYKVKLDVAQDFTSAAVTAVKVIDPTVDATADTNYGVTACQCDSSVSTECATKSMNQNSVLDICVELDDAADGVVIGDIKTLTLKQDSISVAAISGSTANSLTEVSGKDSKDVVIKTRLISGFFTDASAGKSISVSGTVLVKFMNTGRQLASLADLSRDLQVNDGDVASEEDFSFDIELEAEAFASASGINMSFVGNTVIVAAIVGIGGMM